MVDVEELARKLGDPDPQTRIGAAKALMDVAVHKGDINAAIPALAKALSDNDAAVVWYAAQAFDKTAIHAIRKKSRDAALSALTEALSQRVAVWDVLGALVDAASHGTDISVAIPALVRTPPSVKYADFQWIAGGALADAVINEESRGAALPALAKALSDPVKNVRSNAVVALREAIRKCPSVEPLDATQAELRESYGALRNGCRYGKEEEFAGIGLEFSNLMNEIARKRNALAAKRDIMLDDKPKPPKRGQVYQEMRRVRNG
jgi:hypothetical protein